MPFRALFGSQSLYKVAIAYSNFSSIAGLQLNGNAAQSGSALRLTPAAGNQRGTAFSTAILPVTESTSFSTHFQFSLNGGNGTNGADGIGFVLQNSGSGLSALGDFGGAIGYANGTVSNSLCVAFFSFGGNTIAVLSNGSTTRLVQSDIGASPDFNGGGTVYAWVDYNGATDLLSVFVSGASTKPGGSFINYTVNLPSIVGSQAYLGFSGGTGGFNNNQDVLLWTFNEL